jgi:DNA-binding transcriptional ArsR family regulator
VNRAILYVVRGATCSLSSLDLYIVKWQYTNVTIDLETGIKALASDKRRQILAWLKDPPANFRPQVDGDLVRDGVCAVLITEKLGISQPTASEHLRILTDAGFLTGKKIKQWIFYRRAEREIKAFKALLRQEI